MRVLAWGTFDTRAHPRAAILIEGLLAHGHEVVEVRRPLGLSTADRVRILQQPWRLPVLLLRVLRCWAWLVRHGRRAVRAAAPDAVLVGYLGHFDVLLARLVFPGVPVVHDMLIFAADTARDRGAGGVKQALLSWLDRLAVVASDIVVLDTEEHAAMLRPGDRGKACVVPVGAPDEWFAARERAPATARAALDVVFFGLFTPLQGAVTIGQTAGLLADEPDIRLTMIGSGQDLAATRAAAAANPSVRWLAWVEAEELPSVVAAAHVCLGIFAADGKGARVVPNKVFQGAAAGCAVVTSDTPPQRRLLADAAVLVPPADPGALATALRALHADPARLTGYRAAAASVADRRFRPSAVVEPLLARLASI